MKDPRFHVILFQPEIPQNTGNIGRLCAYTACRLHLIRPLGFTITDRHLRRSGMDYWRHLDLRIHEDWESFRGDAESPRRLWLYSTKGTRKFWDARFAVGDGLLFGSESAGVPEWLHKDIGDANRLTIPRFGEQLRSLNLSTSAGVAVYEALRQSECALSPQRGDVGTQGLR